MRPVEDYKSKVFKKAVEDSNESIDELTGFDLCDD